MKLSRFILGAMALAALSGSLAAATNAVTVKAADVNAVVSAPDKVTAAEALPITIDIAVAPGWHIYGKGVSGEYLPTEISVDPELIAKQDWAFPPPKKVLFKALGETLPVYAGVFRASGELQLKPDLKPGDYQLHGALKFQECNDSICKLPQTAQFVLPVTVAAKK